MKTLKELLIEFDAPNPAIKWAGDKTIEQVVKECNKGEWLLDIAKRLKLPERKLISCAGHCVNTVRHLIEDEKSIQLLDMCMNFEDESISFEELKKAREAADTVVACASAAVSYASDYAVAVSAAADYAAVSAAEDAFYANARAVVCASAAVSYAAVSYASDYAAVSAAEDTFYPTRAAVCAADAAASFATRADARKQNELLTANIVRERLGQDIINKVNELLNN